jgi:hypothetical protein
MTAALLEEVCKKKYATTAPIIAAMTTIAFNSMIQLHLPPPQIAEAERL